MKITYIEPGANLWYVMCSRGLDDIIVPVIATEVNDVYRHPTEPNSIWRYRCVDGADYILVPTGKKTELGWDIPEEREPSWLGDAKPTNQFIWIDEPVGHAIQLGDEGLFLTLEEAQRYARPSKKRHLRRRLKQHRAIVQKFIASTWGKNKHPGFDKLPDKKVYVVAK